MQGFIQVDENKDISARMAFEVRLSTFIINNRRDIERQNAPSVRHITNVDV